MSISYLASRRAVMGMLCFPFCLSLLPSRSIAGESGAVIDFDVRNFLADRSILFRDFDGFAVPRGNRLHVLADGGFDIVKKGEFARSKVKSASFVDKVSKVSGVAVTPSDKNDIVDFMSEMPPAQGLSVAMEIRPKNPSRIVETLCRIGMNIPENDMFLVSGMFDDRKKVEDMQKYAMDLDVSPQEIHEYFMVHELSHCVMGMSEHETPMPKGLSSSEEQLAMLRREMFADALSVMFWVRKGQRLRLFDFVLEGRRLEMLEYRSLDHMTAPVIEYVVREFQGQEGRERLLRMSQKDVLDFAYAATERNMPSRGDIVRVLESLFPGMYSEMKKTGSSNEKWKDIRGFLSSPADNESFVSTVFSLRDRKWFEVAPLMSETKKVPPLPQKKSGLTVLLDKLMYSKRLTSSPA